MADEAKARESMDAFRRIVRALRSSHRAAGYLKLTGAQLFVMSVIAAAEEPLSVREVAERTQTDQSTVSVVAGRLVENGILRRDRDPADRRRVALSLTAKGRSLQKRGPATVAQQRLARALLRLTPRDSAELLRLLTFIVAEMGIGAEPATMLFDDTVARPRARKR